MECSHQVRRVEVVVVVVVTFFLFWEDDHAVTTAVPHNQHHRHNRRGVVIRTMIVIVLVGIWQPKKDSKGYNLSFSCLDCCDGENVVCRPSLVHHSHV
eukprot:scaffold2704_cov159-Amphora_coffeaeformis.AAC.5